MVPSGLSEMFDPNQCCEEFTNFQWSVTDFGAMFSFVDTNDMPWNRAKKFLGMSDTDCSVLSCANTHT